MLCNFYLNDLSQCQQHFPLPYPSNERKSVPTQTYLDPSCDEDLDEVLNEFLGTGDISAANKLGDAFLSFWEKRVQKLQHDYAIAGWILSVDSRVRDDVKNRVGTEHRAAMERVVRKLHIQLLVQINPNG